MYKSVTRLFCFEVLSSGFVLNEHLSVKRKRGKRGKPVQCIVTDRPIRSEDDCDLATAPFFPLHLTPVACCCFEFNLIHGGVHEKFLQFVNIITLLLFL